MLQKVALGADAEPSRMHARTAGRTQMRPQHGYAVIFLRRRGSVEAFTQRLPASSMLQLMTECLELTGVNTGGGASGSTVVIKAQHAAALASSLTDAIAAQRTHSLLQLEFETIFEYLQVRTGVQVHVIA
jgi:hypothetical protein